MARRNGYDDEREELSREEELDDQMDEALEDEYDDDAYDEEEYDAYDDEYDDEQEDEDEAHGDAHGGFLSTLVGKIIVGVIALLVLALIVLLVWRFIGMRGDVKENANDPQPLPVMENATKAPGSIVFGPVSDATVEPTDAPTPTPTAEPTDVPEPTATPLPIILTNTPTPSPSPTASPTPTPSPSPTPSPKPTATPRVDLAEAETNREAKLRESASANGKVKKTLKKGEALTVHEAALDKSGKVWYFVSVNDLDTQGWMRDYVIDVDGEIVAPTPTPDVTSTPKTGSDAPAAGQTAEPEESVGIGTGKTVKDANVRKIMNGKVITQLRSGKAVIIHDAKLDKNGNLWYEIQVKGQTTRGFVRDYLIKLDKGVEITRPTVKPKAEKTPSAEAEAAPAQNLLDREVIGRATTNRNANVRVAPKSNGDVVVQLKKGTALLILAKAEEGKNVWYEVTTEDGKTYGFARDYVIDISEIGDSEGTAVSQIVSEDAPAASTLDKIVADSASKVYHTKECGHLQTENLVDLPNEVYAQARGYALCEYCK